jgi:hypothetical protein
MPKRRTSTMEIAVAMAEAIFDRGLFAWEVKGYLEGDGRKEVV